MENRHRTHRLFGTGFCSNVVYLFTFICTLILAGCTFSVAPLPDESLPAKVSALETRVSQLEMEQVPTPINIPPQPDEFEKKVVEIRGLDQAGQAKSLLLETQKLLSFSSLNESSFLTLTTSLPAATHLDYALLHSGVGTDWHLYYTQPQTRIVTVTQVATYRESTENMASLLTGPTFSVSASSLIQPASDPLPNWQDSIRQIQGTMELAPPGRIFPPATAFLLVSEETTNGTIRTLIVFFGIRVDGSEVAPGGIADLFAACDNCVDCYYWCRLIR